MSQVSSELSAKKSIKIIESIDNVDDLSAHVDDAEDRKSVLAASDKRFSELTEPSASSNDEDPKEETPEETEDPSDDEDPEEEAHPDEVVTDELVTPEFLADVAEVVENKLAAEKKFKGENVDHTVTELKESHKAFEKSTDVEGETIRFSEEKFNAFRKAVANQANADQQRRGLSQPNAIDKALFDLHKKLNG